MIGRQKTLDPDLRRDDESKDGSNNIVAPAQAGARCL